MSSEPFDTITASVDPPLVVVTTAAPDARAGCLVGFHSQASIDPLHYSIWLSKANHTHRVALAATYFAVHFLTRDDLALAEHFGTLTGDEVDKFRDMPTESGPGGVPILRNCPTRLVARRVERIDDGGDHTCYTIRPVRVETGDRFEPLRLSHADDLVPGHES